MTQETLFNQPPKDYHNTNKEHRPVLDRRREKAKWQQDKILATFARYPFPRLSACDAWGMHPDMLLTSVRRAISNLTEAGLLEKTDQLKVGIYGVQVHTWRLSETERRK